jgi:hypothetical protein
LNPIIYLTSSFIIFILPTNPILNTKLVTGKEDYFSLSLFYQLATYNQAFIDSDPEIFF